MSDEATADEAGEPGWRNRESSDLAGLDMSKFERSLRKAEAAERAAERARVEAPEPDWRRSGPAQTESETAPTDEAGTWEPDDWEEIQNEQGTDAPTSSRIYGTSESEQARFIADYERDEAAKGFRTWDQWVAEWLFIEKDQPGYATSQESRELYERVMALVAKAQPPALPAPGDTSTPERTDVHTPDLSGSNLTVKQTAQTYIVSERTVMAKLKAGTVPGAKKVPGPNGEQWLIPAAAVAQIWKPRASTPGVEAAAKPEQPDQVQLLRELIDVQAELRAEIAALRNQITELEQLTHRALPVAAADEATSMPAPTERPRWWKRNK
jgi:hypothetical protein